jgi:hypothetical protein
MPLVAESKKLQSPIPVPLLQQVHQLAKPSSDLCQKLAAAIDNQFHTRAAGKPFRRCRTFDAISDSVEAMPYHSLFSTSEKTQRSHRFVQ